MNQENNKTVGEIIGSEPERPYICEIKAENMEHKYKDAPAHSIWKETAQQQKIIIDQQLEQIRQLNKELHEIKKNHSDLILSYCQAIGENEFNSRFKKIKIVSDNETNC